MLGWNGGNAGKGWSWVGVAVGAGLLACGSLQSSAALQGKKKTSKKSVTFEAKPDFARDVKGFTAKFCVKCHADFPKSLSSAESAVAHADLLAEILRKVSTAQMPPQGEAMPTQQQRQHLADWINIATAVSCKLAEPGRVTMRRLNREEYNNSVRDLFGVDLRPADEFPGDDVGNGFDNMGETLSISPLLMEKYISAAEKVAERVIELPYRLRMHLPAASFGGKLTSMLGTDAIVYSNSTAASPVRIVRSGQYRYKVRVYGQQAGPEVVKATISMDGQALKTFDLPNKKDHPMDLEFILNQNSGVHQFEVAFLNDFYEASLPEDRRDRNLAIVGGDVEGPLDSLHTRSQSHRKVIPYDPTEQTEESDARKMLAAFASKAYRKPASTEDVDRLMTVYNVAKKTGEEFERRIQLAVTAILISPRFLYRIEAERPGVRALTGYELASRLSYFIWSSTPDDELMNLAKSDKLQDQAILAAQVKRMVADPRGHALTDNFAGQWLNLRLLNVVTPDPQKNADWNDNLKNAMVTETKMFFDGVRTQNRSVLEFISGGYSYLNETLAKHYKIAGVSGPEFRKVEMTSPTRAGVLTQGSILTLTSNPTRTSPVKRGKWILEQILGTPPPPPPPGIPALQETAPTDITLSVRKRLEMHRKNPACATCHSVMDQLGFGMENFDPTGVWRDSADGSPIDASGVLPTGSKFTGPADLRGILLKDKALFVRNLADRMLTYSLGRGTTKNDKCAVDAIVKTVASDGYKFSTLVTSIVLSDPFRKRQGETTTKP